MLQMCGKAGGAAARVLIVDAPGAERDALEGFLRRHQLGVQVAAESAAVLATLQRGQLDLVVIDAHSPAGDGLALCREACERHGLPVVMMSAHAEASDRVVALELGADDYLQRPVDARELLARIRAVLRRVRRRECGAGCQRFSFSGWTFDAPRRQLLSEEGAAVSLSAVEARLLMAFVERPHTVLSRERLLALIDRQDSHVFDRSIDSQISRLRKKLETEPRRPRLIQTAWGDGYVFAAEVNRSR